MDALLRTVREGAVGLRQDRDRQQHTVPLPAYPLNQRLGCTLPLTLAPQALSAPRRATCFKLSA